MRCTCYRFASNSMRPPLSLSLFFPPLNPPRPFFPSFFFPLPLLAFLFFFLVFAFSNVPLPGTVPLMQFESLRSLTTKGFTRNFFFLLKFCKHDHRRYLNFSIEFLLWMHSWNCNSQKMEKLKRKIERIIVKFYRKKKKIYALFSTLSVEKD